MTSTFTLNGWLQRFGHEVARTMHDVDGEQGRLLTRCCALRDDRMVLHAQLSKTVSAVKAFDLTQDTARAAFDRELALLSCLNKQGLSPDLVGYDRDNGYVVMDWINGPTLKHTLTKSANRQTGVALGAWFARYAGLTHQVPADTNWLDYLSEYDEFGMGQTFGDYHSTLAGMRIKTMAIAKNDGYLGNFIVSPDLGLIGIDYEAARLKPLGWDILVTAQNLTIDFGDTAKPIIGGMVKGWCEQMRGFNWRNFGDLTELFMRGPDIQHSTHAKPDGSNA